MRSRLRGIGLLAFLVVGCAEDPVTPAAVPSNLVLVSGNGQQGTPGYRLPNEVAVQLRDDRGKGVIGATITFASDDQYAVAEPASAVTDSSGVARTWWRLGATLGTQELAARYDALPSVKIPATAASLLVRNVTGRGAGLCILDQDGALSCGRSPTLGAPNPPARIPAPGATRFSEFIMGGSYGCGVTELGRVWCLTLTDIQDPFASFQELPGTYPPLHGLNASSGAFRGFCALSPVGQGYCWGHNNDNRFAQVLDVHPTSPTAISTSQPFASIVVGQWSGCGLTADGTGWCWGSNADGLAGQPATTSTARTEPAPLPTALKFSSLVLDNEFRTACGLAKTGGVWCWGRGYPHLGLGGWGGVPAGNLPQRLPGFDAILDAQATGYWLVTLHPAGSSITTALSGEDRGSVVFRAVDFGGHPMRSFLSGPTFDLACGTIEGFGQTLCRSVPEQIRPVAGILYAPGVGVFGIPPQ